MKRFWGWIPSALVLLGVTLVVLGQVARTDLTPAGPMDCGCGRAHDCVTKRRVIDVGLASTLAGSALALGGMIGGGVHLARRTRRARSL